VYYFASSFSCSVNSSVYSINVALLSGENNESTKTLQNCRYSIGNSNLLYFQNKASLLTTSSRGSVKSYISTQSFFDFGLVLDIHTFLVCLPFLHSHPPGVKWINYFSCLFLFFVNYFLSLLFTLFPASVPPRCQSDLRSSGMLRGVDWLLFTEVPEQPLALIFCRTLQNVTDKQYRNVGN
jgi:hypothetical protein